MIVLSFDTSLAACSTAVVDTGARVPVLAASYCEPGKGHAEILLDMIGDVMSRAGVDFTDIERQIVTIGPGSFTGVRVALSAARGFRIAHDIPICGLSTMQAISANLSKLEPAVLSSPVAVIVDARRHQAYGQVFDEALKPLCAPALIEADDLRGWLEPWESMTLTLMGSGVGLLVSDEKPLPEMWTAIAEYASPDAACFSRAFKDIAPGDMPPDPLYLRKPDAKPQIIGQLSV